MMGGQEIWSICRMLGWHPISSQLSSGQTRAHRLPDSLILVQYCGTRTRAIDGTEPDRLPGAELRGGCQTARWPGASLVVAVLSLFFLLFVFFFPSFPVSLFLVR